MTNRVLATDPADRADRVGLLAGLLAAAAGEITASATGRGRSPASGLARGLVDLSPAMLVDGGVALVGKADKPGLAALATGAASAAALAGGALASRRPVVGATLAVAPHVAGGLLALRHGDASPRDTATATVAGVAVAALAVVPVRVPPPVVLASAVGAAAVAVAADRRSRRAARVRLSRAVPLPAPQRSLPPAPADAAGGGADGVAPLLARPGQLPVIDITVPEPRIDPATWRLDVDGEVGSAYALSLPDLLSLPLEERDLLLVCVHNPVGGDRMGCARWTGVGLDALLDRAGAPEQGWLVAEAVDGYTNVLPLAQARAHGFLAVGMGGEPLPREHGSPARLLVPGRTGQDGQLKWLRRLTVTGTEPLSYWGRRGWQDGSYPVHPSARIDAPGAHRRLTPGEVVVRGYAWAPPVGVDRVQLQVDGGPWADAELGVDLGPEAWRPWSFAWQAAPGAHELRVRCRTSSGQWQEEGRGTPYPHGVQGVHAVTVHVGGDPLRPVLRRVVAGAGGRLGWAWRSLAAWRPVR